MKLEATARLLASEDWWDELDEGEQEDYVEEHPNSKHSPDHDRVDRKEAPADIKPTPNSAPKKKPKGKETSLTKYLLHKGGEAGKKKALELLKKGGHGALQRLIDPLAMTDIGKKGKLPELPFRFKSKEAKSKDLKDQLAKMKKRAKGFGKNVPENLKDQMQDLKDKIGELED